MNRVLFIAVFAAAFLLTISGSVRAWDNDRQPPNKSAGPFVIKVAPWGHDGRTIERAKRRAEESPEVRKALKGTVYRLVSFDYIENEDKTGPTRIPSRFKITFYDYTNDRVIAATGDFAGTLPITVSREFTQPGIGGEELRVAFDLVKNSAEYRSAYKAGKLRLYEAMPPTTYVDGERLVNVGITVLPENGLKVIGVSFKRGKTVSYKDGAPPTSRSSLGSCGIPSAGQGSTGPGVAGQASLVVRDAGQNVLWEMLIIRPSSSSGTRRSGIEIRDVKYRGKTVFKRAHAPVLNVEYVNDVCGPFRDWQYAEGLFDASDTGAQDIAPGIRVLADGEVPQTAIDDGTDNGNYQGVAIYQQNVGLGNEVVLVSEMNAGWYRYIMEWRFAENGTIRPRYGFGSTSSGCTCVVHTHHVYWRFDFDVVGPTNKVYQVERGRKFLQPISKEMTRLRSYQTNRSMLVQNSNGDEAYLLVPNLTDGFADTYGRSDFWVLRYKNVQNGSFLDNQIDDGWNSVGGTCTSNSGSCINIDSFINDESVRDTDVVVWYGAHFLHSDGANLLDRDRSGLVLTGPHVLGPDLRPVRW